MNRENIGKLMAGLCVTVVLVAMSCGAAHAQKLVKPANGGLRLDQEKVPKDLMRVRPLLPASIRASGPGTTA